MCIKLVNYWDKYTEMHGQKNVKKNRVLFVQPAWNKLVEYRISYSCVRASLIWFFKLQPTRCNYFIYYYVFIIYYLLLYIIIYYIIIYILYIIIYYLFLKVSTCFGRFLRPPSGAHNCTLSFRYCQPILLQAGIVAEMELRLQQYWLTIPEADCTVMCSWWWAEEQSQTCRTF